MPREFLPKVATANDLLEGDVIYFTGTDWSRDHSDAAVATTEEAADDLLAKADQFPLQVVGVYLADAKVVNGKPAPVHFREVFRTKGPSNYTLGKQQAGA